MKTAILGAGKVGTTLGRAFRRHGHEVIYAVRDPEEPRHAKLRAEADAVLSVPVAVCQAEVVVLAAPWSATQAVLEAAGSFEGKPLLDATNPIGPGFALTHGHDDSGAEQVQRWATEARVVKVFNTTGVENMADPVYPGGKLAMFLCGDDEPACDVASRLAGELGFEAVRVGGLERARLLEPMMVLWVLSAQALGTRDLAFRLMRR